MSGPTDTGAPAQDEREIRAIVDRMFDAWGRGDAVAYHADLTDDADYVAFDGSRRGKADSIRSHETLFRTVLYGSRLTGAVESIRFVTPDVAVVHLTGSVIEGWRQQMRRRRLSRQTMVVVRRDGRWQVTAFHNTRVRPLSTSGPMVELAAGSSAGAPTEPGASSAEHGHRTRRWIPQWPACKFVRGPERTPGQGRSDPRPAGSTALG
jgi:uncharacterized protein (TIGR02246 family)